MVEFISSKLLPKLIKKLVSIRAERSAEIQKINDVFGDCENLANYYVEPNCQHGNPADEDDIASPISVPIFQVINKILNRVSVERDGRNQLFVLADAGMGKTSLLVMIKYFNLCSFWPQEYDCKLLKLGPETISEINNTKNKSKTVLLLDALDEDPFAWKSYERRVRDILRESTNFRNVIITCRTQFFPISGNDPFYRAGMINFLGYTCPVLYLSLFDDEQVEDYLSSSLKYNEEQISEAKSLLKHMRTLKSRPLLLAHMQDLIESKEIFDNTYNVYNALIQAWLNRETRKQDYLDINNLWLACLLIAVEMTLQEKRAISPLDIDKLRVRNADVGEIKRLNIGGRSLLNKNSFASYRFSHYSIQEFLVAEAIIRGVIDQNDISRCNLTNLTIQFLHYHYDSELGRDKSMHISPGVNWDNLTINKKEYKNHVFVGARASNARIYKTDIRGSNLYLSDFTSADMDAVSLEKSNVSQCNFEGASISSCSFKNAVAAGSDFSKSKCKSVVFKSANIRRCDFSNSIVVDCKFKGADLMYTNFDNANLTGSDFRGCANLTSIQLEKALTLDYVKMDEELEDILRKDGVLKKYRGF